MLANEHLRAGNLGRARSLFRRILKRDPDNAEAWHRFGLCCAEAGDLTSAVAALGRAIQIGGPEPVWCVNLGRALRLLGHRREASACFRQAFAQDPLNASLAFEFGVELAASDQLSDALAALQHSTDIDPTNPEAWFHCGYVHYRAGNLDAAAVSYERALTLAPDHAETHFHLGVVRMKQQSTAAATKSFRRTVELDPQHAEAHNNLGLLEHDAGNFESAVHCFERAIRHHPGRYYPAEYNLARALAGHQDLERAVEAYEKAVRWAPEHLDARLGLANMLTALGHPEAALPQLRAAVELCPDSAAANLNLSLALLQLGQWDEGWPLYQWRHKTSTGDPRLFDKPLWTGWPLHGERILLHSEQGLGDTLQCARYVPLVRDRGGVPILECQAPLVPLLATVEGAGHVIARGDPLPAFDCHVPLMNLPGILQSTPDSVPSDVPYLLASSDAAEAWRVRLARHTAPSLLRVGLTWAGNPDHANDKNRSMIPDRLNPLRDVDGIAWFGLQKGARTLPGLPLSDLGTDLTDFGETAAAILNLDLVISVDTSVAHLAGALARPVWTLLTHAADWRWLMDRADTPWYPTMRLFRQPRRGDWESVIETVRAELESLVLHRSE